MAERYGDAEFGDSTEFVRPRGGNGCMKGCLIGCGILFVLGIIAIGITAYFGAQFAKNLITQDPAVIETRLDEMIPGAKVPENYEGKFGMRMKFPFLPINLDMLFILPKDAQMKGGGGQPGIREILGDDGPEPEEDKDAEDDAKKDDAKKDDAKKDEKEVVKKKPATFFQIIRFKIDDPNMKQKPQMNDGIEKQLKMVERKKGTRVVDGHTIETMESKYENEKGRKLVGLEVAVDQHTTITAISPADRPDDKAIDELLKSSLNSIEGAKKKDGVNKKEDAKAPADAEKKEPVEAGKKEPAKKGPQEKKAG